MPCIDPAPDRSRQPVQVAALYRFTRFEDPAAMRAMLSQWCAELNIRGTLLIAREGINGTVSGLPLQMEELVSRLGTLPGCADIEIKYSEAAAHPFQRMKVKVKREIVTMGVEGLDPAREAGVHLPPEEWNRLLADPSTILIDTRNDYEVALGSFAGAINPVLQNFSEFPAWFANMSAQWRKEGGEQPRIAMFCTGGIRCEKSTAYARSLGFEEVYHLNGGILRYLEDISSEESLWQGTCFVFDKRVSVGSDLRPAQDRMCKACGRAFAPTQTHDCVAT